MHFNCQNFKTEYSLFKHPRNLEYLWFELILYDENIETYTHMHLFQKRKPTSRQVVGQKLEQVDKKLKD